MTLLPLIALNSLLPGQEEQTVADNPKLKLYLGGALMYY